MKRLLTPLLITATLLMPTLAALALDKDKPDVIGLLFYADWCGSCKVLEPKLNAVKRSFADTSIVFTRVDMTDDYTKSQSKLLAGALGLSEIYAENAPKTGFMLLISTKDKKVLSKLVKTQSEDEIRKTISNALSSASAGKGSGSKPSGG